jgi:AraC-like DNA-binding protein
MRGLAGPAEPSIQAATLYGWNDIVGDAFPGCIVDAAAPVFEGRLDTCSIEDLRFVKIAAGASYVRRWSQSLPRRNAHAALVHLQASGSGLHRQAGREAPIARGHAILCDADRPYEIEFAAPYEMFVLQIPEPIILRHQPDFDIDRAAGRLLDTSRSQLLLAFLAAAWEQIDMLRDDPDWRDCVSRVVTDLALRAINAGDPVQPTGAGPEMRRAVLAYVRANLDDPGMRTGSIAKALGVSPRSVQNVFEALSTTASAYIMEGRLARAAAFLRAARGNATITQIAYDCGFSDSAYFSRCFHKAYGMAPRRFQSSLSKRSLF